MPSPEASRANGLKGGRPKGSKEAQTLEKEAIRLRIRELVSASLDSLVEAQVANARGLNHLVKRDPKTGKFERIGPDGIGDGTGVEIWEKDPNVSAFTDLLDRASDKPKNQVMEIADVTDDVRIVRLQNARKRATEK